MCPNFGDRIASRAVRECICSLALVASSISPNGEGIGNALCGVGDAHIIDDVRDSITLARKGALLVCVTVLNSWMSPFLQE